MDVYDAISLRWNSKEPKQAWFAISHSPARLVGKFAVTIYDWAHFETVVCKNTSSVYPDFVANPGFILVIIIFSNMFTLTVRIFESAQVDTHANLSATNLIASWDTLIFAGRK